MNKKKIPTSKISRSAISAVSATKIGIKHIGYVGANILSDTETKKKNKATHEEKIGKELIKTLNLLKGTALKVAQFLSMEAELFPESIRKELAKACHQVTPLNNAIIYKAFKKEFGEGPHDVFKNFNDDAFAAASLGQVHLGSLENNAEVAIKIQYPGIAHTITNDMKLVRSFAGKLLKYAGFEVKKHILENVLDEIESRLHDEINYEHEAKQLQWFKKKLNHPHIQIPHVYTRYSTERILTMEKLHGLHLKKWLATHPSQEQRNHFGQTLLDFFFYSAFTLKRLHADPHPGNYLFCENSVLGIIDFGCTKKLSDDFPKKEARLLDLIIKDNSEDREEELIQAHIDIGMFPPETTLHSYRKNLKKAIKIIEAWFAIPWQQESYDFSQLPNCTYYNSMDVGASIQHYKGIHRDQIYFDRSFMGILLMLKEIKATVITKNKYFGIGRT